MMSIPNPICWFETAWRTLVYPGTLWVSPHAYASGHSFMEVELHENCTVRILRCQRCGHYSMGWWHGHPPAGYPIPPGCEECDGHRKLRGGGAP